MLLPVTLPHAFSKAFVEGKVERSKLATSFGILGAAVEAYPAGQVLGDNVEICYSE
jgi:hypothetical protein